MKLINTKINLIQKQNISTTLNYHKKKQSKISLNNLSVKFQPINNINKIKQQNNNSHIIRLGGKKNSKPENFDGIPILQIERPTHNHSQKSLFISKKNNQTERPKINYKFPIQKLECQIIYIKSIITYLKNTEFIPKDFRTTHGIDEKYRSKMIDWMVQVMGSFKSNNITLFRAINIMDQYLQSTTNYEALQNLHLIGISCIFISMKNQEVYPLKLKYIYQKVGHKKLTKQEIKQKEMEILTCLKYNILKPTIYQFMTAIFYKEGYFLKQAVKDKIDKLFFQITIMVVFEYQLLLKHKKSQIAISILYITLKIIEKKEDQINSQFQVNKFHQETYPNQSILIKIGKNQQYCYLDQIAPYQFWESLFQNAQYLQICQI